MNVYRWRMWNLLEPYAGSGLGKTMIAGLVLAALVLAAAFVRESEPPAQQVQMEPSAASPTAAGQTANELQDTAGVSYRRYFPGRQAM